MKFKTLFALVVMLLSGCSTNNFSQPTQAPSAIPSISPELLPTERSTPNQSPIPTISFTTDVPSSTIQIPALEKISLEFYRKGKTYEIVVGYDIGEAFFYATPRPELPKNLAEVSSAELERYGDFDNDGETEFIVSLMYCGAYCTEMVQIYEYDDQKDLYYVADEIGAKAPAVENYIDLNGDGNLEIKTANYGFCFQCSSAVSSFTTFSILRYIDGNFVDVTTEFPDLIQQDADADLKLAKANEQNTGYLTLSAYLYNMYRLGKADEARSIFDQVCMEVIKPSVGCVEFRSTVEKYIEEFESQK